MSSIVLFSVLSLQEIVLFGYTYFLNIA